MSSRMNNALSVLAAGPVGYTMQDIQYKWHAGLTSVGISNEVELPQFRVLGHKQRETVFTLSTGNQISTTSTTPYVSLSVFVCPFPLRALRLRLSQIRKICGTGL